MALLHIQGADCAGSGATEALGFGIEAMPNEVVIQSSRDPFLWISKGLFTYTLSPRAILAYVALAYYRHNLSSSVERMTMRTLAARIGIGESTMMRGLDELRRKGVVKIRHRSQKSANGKKIPLANFYDLVELDSSRGGPL